MTPYSLVYGQHQVGNLAVDANGRRGYEWRLTTIFPCSTKKFLLGFWLALVIWVGDVRGTSFLLVAFTSYKLTVLQVLLC
jgi:hypothetical protein